MPHETFYRKYRSKTFDEIVGQHHVVQTLKNAIEMDRLSHAYIFSGPRGTGKTSTARILAKSVNCRNGKTPSPCLQCDLCLKISAGTAVDVVEIDAASNTGVDNIRTLNEQVNFTPVECRYKLYIIDEAHMLSGGAFNALLKTIEEPPANTIFILATTESHKIPATIHSRCQHLHFRTLTVTEITEQLRKIASAEAMTIPDQSLVTLARNAGGCMRDAISLLDQVYSFKGNTVSQEDVLLMLGTTNFESLSELLRSFFTNDSQATMAKVNALIESGINLTRVVTDITELLKHMIFEKLGLKESGDFDQARLDMIRQLVPLVSTERLNELLEVFSKIEMELRYFPNPSLLLQVKFLTLLNKEPVQRENPPAPAFVTPEAPKKIQPRPVAPPAPAPVAETTPQKKTEYVIPSPATAPPDFNDNQPLRQAPVQQKPAPGLSAPAASNPPVAQSSHPLSAANTGIRREAQPQTHGAQSATAPVAGIPKSIEDIRRHWPRFLTVVKEKAGRIYIIMGGSEAVKLAENEVYVRLKQDTKFFREKLTERPIAEMLTGLTKDIFGGPFLIKIAEGDDSLFFQSDEQNSDEPSYVYAGSDDTAAEPAENQTDNQKMKQINHIIKMFDGTIVS